MKRLALLLSFAALVLAACAPGATSTVDTEAVLAALEGPCVNDPPPVVAVIDFENTTSRFGTTVTGVEEAATARLITLLETILGPLWVWLAIGEEPGVRTIIGGALVVGTLAMNTILLLRASADAVRSETLAETRTVDDGVSSAGRLD